MRYQGASGVPGQGWPRELSLKLGMCYPDVAPSWSSPGGEDGPWVPVLHLSHLSGCWMSSLLPVLSWALVSCSGQGWWTGMGVCGGDISRIQLLLSNRDTPRLTWRMYALTSC